MAKKIASSFLNMFVTLFVITLISGFSLGAVYSITKAPIAQAKLQKKIKAIKQVLPAFDNNPLSKKVKVKGAVDSIEIYPGFQKNHLVGVAVTGASNKGFSGLVKLMVGFDTKGKIVNISVLEQKETPGLGTKMKEPKFLKQFIGKNPKQNNLKVKKDGGEIDAISGATISSRAFVESVYDAHKAFVSKMDTIKP